MPWVEPIARRAAWATIAGITVAFLALASKVCIPLALGMLLAFLLTPIVNLLTIWVRSRIVAVVITCTLTFAILGGAGFIAGEQMYDFASQVSNYHDGITKKLLALRIGPQGVIGKATHAIDQIQKDISATTQPAAVQKVELVSSGNSDTTIYSAAAIVGPLFEPGTLLVFVSLLAVMLLLYGPDLRDRVLVLAGTEQISMTTQALEEASQRIGKYLLFQAMVNTLFGITIAIGLTIIGVPNALLFGCLAGLLRFIPVIGPWLGAALPVLLSIAVFAGWHQMFEVLALFGGVELTLNFAIEPWAYGTSTGISGIAIVVAILFWTWVWGALGLLLAVPMTVCIVVMGKYVEPLRVFYILFSDEQVLSGDRRLYHRLVGGDLVSAETVVEKSIAEIGDAETCDQLLLPVIQTARTDHDRGSLSDQRYQLLVDAIDSLITKPEASEIEIHPTIACVSVESADQLCSHVVAGAITRLTGEPLLTFDNLMRSELTEHARSDGFSTLILVTSSADSFARARLLVKGILARSKTLKLIVVDIAHVSQTYPWDTTLNVTLCKTVTEVVDRVQQIQRERISMDNHPSMDAVSKTEESPVGTA